MIRLAIAQTVIILAALASSAAGEAGAAALSGTVVTDDSFAAPVRRAIVTISGSGLTPSRSVITDDDGRFAFDGLPAGRFDLSAARPAFITSVYGARRPGGTGKPIAVAAGERVTGVTIRLARGAVLTGIVTDGSGNPAPAVSVAALRTEVPLTIAASAESDDRGIYRIFGLRPGAYLVATSSRVVGRGDIDVPSTAVVDAVLSALKARRDTPGVAAVGTADPAGPRRAFGWSPVFYPGTPSVSDAVPLTLGAGEERSGVDLQFSYVRTVSVSGVVLQADGRPAAGAFMSLSQDLPRLPMTFGIGSNPLGSEATAQDGRFRYDNVPAGRYRLTAGSGVASGAPMLPSAVRNSPLLVAETEVTVSGQDVSGVTLTLGPGLRIEGRIVFEAGEVPADLTKFRIAARAYPPGRTDRSKIAAVNAEGTFTIAGLAPGSYTLATTVPASSGGVLWPRSAIAGGRDLLDVPLELTAAGIRDVVVVFTARHTLVSGSVTDGGGAAADTFVVVFPADRAEWRSGSRRVRLTRTGEDGRFVIRDLPAGDYLVATADDVEAADLDQPELFERLARTAVQLSVTDGEQKIAGSPRQSAAALNRAGPCRVSESARRPALRRRRGCAGRTAR